MVGESAVTGAPAMHVTSMTSIISDVLGDDRLAALGVNVEVPRGRIFIHEGAPAEHFCILIFGSAKLYKLLPDGRCQIIGFGYARSFLGVASSESYAFSAEALEPIRMYRISRPKLQTALHECGAMEQRLLDLVVNDLVQAQEQMLLLGRKTANERLATFLLFQSTRPQPREVRWPRIHLPMSRSDIADYLGLNVDTVSRSLAELKKRGVIAVPNVREVVILHLSGLETLAQGPLHSYAADAGKGLPPTRRVLRNIFPDAAAVERHVRALGHDDGRRPRVSLGDRS